jgi:peptidoglycan DL-endopeptidase CwlO
VVAGRVKSATAAQLDAAWAATTPARLTVLLTALAQVGKRYQYNGAGPDAFDCSGLVQYAWAEVGVKLPHNDVQQIDAVAPRTDATMAVADLAEYPGHVALYLGVGKAIVHAEQTGVPVRVTDYAAATRFGSPLP